MDEDALSWHGIMDQCKLHGKSGFLDVSLLNFLVLRIFPYIWHSWPQAVDDLLEDMELPVHRSGGNWFTWPFKVIESKEILSLGDERREKRQQKSQS